MTERTTLWLPFFSKTAVLGGAEGSIISLPRYFFGIPFCLRHSLDGVLAGLILSSKSKL